VDAILAAIDRSDQAAAERVLSLYLEGKLPPGDVRVMLNDLKLGPRLESSAIPTWLENIGRIKGGGLIENRKWRRPRPGRSSSASPRLPYTSTVLKASSESCWRLQTRYPRSPWAARAGSPEPRWTPTWPAEGALEQTWIPSWPNSAHPAPAEIHAAGVALMQSTISRIIRGEAWR